MATRGDDRRGSTEPRPPARFALPSVSVADQGRVMRATRFGFGVALLCAALSAGAADRGSGHFRKGEVRIDVRHVIAVVVDEAGTEADFVLILDLRADGTAQIASIEKAEFRGRVGRTEVQQELYRWVKSVRFDMELVDGHAVPSRVRIPVVFAMGPQGGRDALVAELQAKAQASRECLAASGEPSRPVALESVVTVIPSPAG